MQISVIRKSKRLFDDNSLSFDRQITAIKLDCDHKLHKNSCEKEKSFYENELFYVFIFMAILIICVALSVICVCLWAYVPRKDDKSDTTQSPTSGDDQSGGQTNTSHTNHTNRRLARERTFGVIKE